MKSERESASSPATCQKGQTIYPKEALVSNEELGVLTPLGADIQKLLGLEGFLGVNHPEGKGPTPDKIQEIQAEIQEIAARLGFARDGQIDWASAEANFKILNQHPTNQR